MHPLLARTRPILGKCPKCSAGFTEQVPACPVCGVTLKWDELPTDLPEALDCESFDERFELLRLGGPWTEVSWFALGELAGLVTQDDVDGEFTWAVLAKGANPELPEAHTPIDLRVSLPTQRAAEEALFAALISYRDSNP